jgi:hypothetical protein
MTGTMNMKEASCITATGDVWLFRGRKVADRAIRAFTNSPVNHVGMVIAIDDLPPLLWHAELGSSLTDAWTGARTRGAQLHRLEHAVGVWTHEYGQRAWLRPLDAAVTPEMENQALAAVAELAGRGFPRPVSLAWRWFVGRFRRPVALTDLYCAELVAVTYERMGLLDAERPANWYDPGRFWSGDRLRLSGGAALGQEIRVTDVPPPPERGDR